MKATNIVTDLKFNKIFLTCVTDINIIKEIKGDVKNQP